MGESSKCHSLFAFKVRWQFGLGLHHTLWSCNLLSDPIGNSPSCLNREPIYPEGKFQEENVANARTQGFLYSDSKHTSVNTILLVITATNTTAYYIYIRDSNARTGLYVYKMWWPQPDLSLFKYDIILTKCIFYSLMYSIK